MVVTYYVKLFRIGSDRRSSILMSLLLLVGETINKKTQMFQQWRLLQFAVVRVGFKSNLDLFTVCSRWLLAIKYCRKEHYFIGKNPQYLKKAGKIISL